MKFIPFRVSAEVVMVLEDQNLCAGTGFFAIEMCSRQPGDSPAYDNKIVFVWQLLRRTSSLPERSVAQAVRNFKRTGVASAQSGGSWRIVRAAVLRLIVANAGRPHPGR